MEMIDVTWEDEDRVRVEEAVLIACENTKYPNDIDEIFSGETWIWDTYETATSIRDKIEYDCEDEGVYDVSEDKIKEYVEEYVEDYIKELISKIYENVLFKIEDNSDVKIIK